MPRGTPTRIDSSLRRNRQQPAGYTQTQRQAQHSFPDLHRSSAPLQKHSAFGVPKAVVQACTTMFLPAAGLDPAAGFLIMVL